jgi:DNA topoisomerase IB
METIVINGKEYKFMRPAAGSYECKFNRATKLAMRFEELDEKFNRMIEKGNGITKNARLALACRLMMYTGIRVGNEDSAEGYMTKPHPNSKKKPEFVKTYGLTTLKAEHIIVAPHKTCLNFIGKKQVENSFFLKGKLAKQVRVLVEMCEDTLFGISAYELTKFIKTYVGKNFSPKDFRTMRANMVAYETLSEIEKREFPKSKREFNSEIKEIAVKVSEHLNNTPGVCKASYIDPKLWDYVEQIRPVIKNGKR